MVEDVYFTGLADERVGIEKRKPSPLFRDFAQRFVDHVAVRHESKPQTVTFQAAKLSRLLEAEALSLAYLDRIDEAMIETYVQERRKTVGPATVNRELATLRRLLRLAHEWKEINRVPKIRLLAGELRDGKSKTARRTIPLTDKAAQMLRNRERTTSGELVFANRYGRRYLVTSINHLHQKARALVGLGRDFVIHSPRHTMLTRLGESGVDAFTIMRIAGHSCITVSQRSASHDFRAPAVRARALREASLLGEEHCSEP